MNNVELIDGLEDVIVEAENFVNEYGVPICDFKPFSGQLSSKQKFERASRRLKILQRNSASYLLQEVFHKRRIVNEDL